MERNDAGEIMSIIEIKVQDTEGVSNYIEVLPTFTGMQLIANLRINGLYYDGVTLFSDENGQITEDSTDLVFNEDDTFQVVDKENSGNKGNMSEAVAKSFQAKLEGKGKSRIKGGLWPDGKIYYKNEIKENNDSDSLYK